MKKNTKLVTNRSNKILPLDDRALADVVGGDDGVIHAQSIGGVVRPDPERSGGGVPH